MICAIGCTIYMPKKIKCWKSSINRVPFHTICTHQLRQVRHRFNNRENLKCCTTILWSLFFCIFSSWPQALSCIWASIMSNLYGGESILVWLMPITVLYDMGVLISDMGVPPNFIGFLYCQTESPLPQFCLNIYIIHIQPLSN